ncbi:Uncharacterised protein [Pseudomonas putida]|nr:Uncharacterised protein [Pseudomonas putida]CAB5652665.1 Uncharacterised protein [Pseudomonas putida]CAB5693331.1 Uncharacterised protein [Pseudomonas putida]CAB5705140.1 Uncharacterised protein [Pseudomonas putida]CAC9682169.1 Uncharacterised protein [Pseudomonas putida]
MGFRVGCEGGWIESGGAYEIALKAGTWQP